MHGPMMSDTRIMIKPSLCTWGPKTKQRHTSQPSYYGALPQRVKTSWSNKQRYNLKYWYWEALRHHKPAKDFPFCALCVCMYHKMCGLSPCWNILNSDTLRSRETGVTSLRGSCGKAPWEESKQRTPLTRALVPSHSLKLTASSMDYLNTHL